MSVVVQQINTRAVFIKAQSVAVVTCMTRDPVELQGNKNPKVCAGTPSLTFMDKPLESIFHFVK
jgi:hypothetical protein